MKEEERYEDEDIKTKGRLRNGKEDEKGIRKRMEM